MITQTPQRKNSDSGKPINRLAEATAGIASQQWPQTSSAIYKPTTKNTLSFHGQNEKIETFEDLFQTMFKMQPEKSKAMTYNQFLSHLQKEALQTFRDINDSNKRTLKDVLTIFRRNYYRPQSPATAEHKWLKFTFNPNTKPFSDFLQELKECAERAFASLPQQMRHSLLYAKIPA